MSAKTRSLLSGVLQHLAAYEDRCLRVKSLSAVTSSPCRSEAVRRLKLNHWLNPRSATGRHCFRSGVAVVALALVAGCMVGPDFHRPSPPAARGYARELLPAQTASADVAGGEAQRLVEDMNIPGQWWALFHAPALNALISESIKANPSLEAAQAALRQAQENVYAQQGFYYPDVQASLTPSRQRNATGTVAPTLASGVALYSLYTPQVSVSYALDVWGGNRRQVESLQAQADVLRFQVEATYLTLTSNIVAAAIQEASLRAQIAATEEIVRIESKQLELLRTQYRLGAIAMADVVAQDALLAQTEATLPGLQKQLSQQRDQLATLAGRPPSEEPDATFQLSELQLPQELPLSLPSKLVEHRPDVRSAEAQLHAASALVGVAVANQLPQFTINAGAGSTATQVSQLFASGTGFWNLAANLTGPLFDGGTLYHRKRAADASLEQAAAQYRSTVISACQNVADVLHALYYDAIALAASVRAADAAFTSLEIARRATELGSTNYLPLLNAEQTYQQALVTVAQARASRFADTAALFQALGGGWWSRNNAEAEQARTQTGDQD